MITSQIGGKWVLYLHFSLLLIPVPFSMLKLPFLFWMLQVQFLAIWTLEHHFPKLEGERSANQYHTCGSVIEAKRKSTLSAALQVPFLTTRDNY